MKNIALGVGLACSLLFGKFAYDVYPSRGDYKIKNDVISSLGIPQEVQQETHVMGRNVYEMSSDDLSRLALMIYNKKEIDNKENLLARISEVRSHQSRIESRASVSIIPGAFSLVSLVLGLAGYNVLNKKEE